MANGLTGVTFSNASCICTLPKDVEAEVYVFIDIAYRVSKACVSCIGQCSSSIQGLFRLLVSFDINIYVNRVYYESIFIQRIKIYEIIKKVEVKESAS